MTPAPPLKIPGVRRPRTPHLPRPSARGWLTLVLTVLFVAFAGALWFLAPDEPGEERSIDELRALIGDGQVARATFLDADSRIVGLTTTGQEFWIAYPASDSATALLLGELIESNAAVAVDGQAAKGAVRLTTTGLLPLLILAALFGLLFLGGQGGAAGEVRRFGTLTRRGGGRAEPPSTRFAAVAGADEAVAELQEIVAYLRDPGRYAELGAAPPKGVLLFGPPGTGKTLIARATAGEAGVPFFSVAGAEFVESLVGVGAARIRDLFENVRAVAPAIVFIDEIDAAGRRRGSGASGGGSDEREQTLNQLLVELDGFAAGTGVVVMAATNRPDILDPALLRPGRFDRHVMVEAPDLAGRERILALHTSGKPLAEDVDLHRLARRTPGLTGADLANVVNEAALLAVRAGHAAIGEPELTEAVDRLVGGTRRRGQALNLPARRRVAVHEGGHALVAASLGEEIHRVSTVARGRGLGSVDVAGEALLLTRDDLLDRITVYVSGRAAEELVLGAPSTGGEHDMEEATRLARDLVVRHGMSPAVGRARLVGTVSDEFLGGDAELGALSDDLRRRIEEEVTRVLDDAVARAKHVLGDRRTTLDALVARLLEDESLDGEELAAMLAPHSAETKQ